ncbi:MAG: glycosyltransferase family 2 protein [Acidimicrobiales bacterium]
MSTFRIRRADAERRLDALAQHAYLTLLRCNAGASSAPRTGGRERPARPLTRRAAVFLRSALARCAARTAQRVRSSYPLDASHDTRAYHAWLERRGESPVLGGSNDSSYSPTEGSCGKSLPNDGSPLFTVVVPVFRPPVWALRRCIDSVLTQTYPSWELRLCDDAGGEDAVTVVLDDAARRDPRVHVTTSPTNEGIAAATNHALQGAHGQYVAFLDNDDELSPSALEVMARAIKANPAVDVLYSDSDKIGPDGQRFSPALKPGWSPNLLLSMMYLGHLLVVRRPLVDEVGGLRSEFDGSQDHDLALRCTEVARAVVHVPEILYHWRASSTSAATNPTTKAWAHRAGRRSVEEALLRRGIAAAVKMSPTTAGYRYDVRRELRPTSGCAITTVAIIVHDGTQTCSTRLRRCLDELRATAGTEAEFLLVDATTSRDTQRTLGVSFAVTARPGWAAGANEALSLAQTEVLALVAPGLAPRQEAWLARLVAPLMEQDVAVVGGRILAGHHLVHCGIVPEMRVSAGRVLEGLPRRRAGYQSMAIAAREVSAVGGDCMACSVAAARDLAGFDEAPASGDAAVSHCLVARSRGARVLYEPACELEMVGWKRRPFRHRMTDSPMPAPFETTLTIEDPYYHRALSLDDPYCRLST